MSCNYEIRGTVMLRRTAEVIEATDYARKELLGEDYVEVKSIDVNTLEIRLDFDDVTTIHTPGYVKGFLESISPHVIGCGAFDLATGGENWTEWIGDSDAIKRHKSKIALATIEEVLGDLVKDDLAKAVKLLQKRVKKPAPI